jgi:hypothetical protein
MATTATASNATAQPRLYHGGVTAARGAYTAGGTTISASHIILMCKIPNHVWVLDGYVAGVSGAADTVWKVGVVAETDCGTVTLSSTGSQLVRFNSASLPFKVSLSDSANPQYKWLYLTHSTGTTTATHSLQVMVQYAATGAVV